MYKLLISVNQLFPRQNRIATKLVGRIAEAQNTMCEAMSRGKHQPNRSECLVAINRLGSRNGT